MIKSTIATELTPARSVQTEQQYIPIKECPLCHTSFGGYDEASFLLNGNLMIVHFCPMCEEIFLASYSSHYMYPSTFEWAAPMDVVNQEFSSVIRDLSYNFVNIYNEAYHAEQHGLTSICGMGYRRALEFLVKDFAIYMHPDDKETIKATSLSKCIKDYIEHSKIQKAAERAAWLGNDHSHYLSKHDDKDLSDLKSIIDLVVFYVDMEIKASELDEIKPK